MSADLLERLRAGERAALARAITLVESRKAGHREAADRLVQDILPYTGGARRVGITGVPGVGKSTLIDALGTMLTGRGARVAVLAVDPSSTRTGGSILGDKTRMARLAADPAAFIRPSPSAGTLGGVAARTREAMLICEAAGFDIVIVETVGIGQSETAVADMVDTFLVLALPGAGDDLQGLKKGVIELADIIAVNKAEGDNARRAARAAADIRAALHILAPVVADWQPEVLTCSGLAGEGLDALWRMVEAHEASLEKSGALARKRQDQQARWMWAMLENRLRERLGQHEGIRAALPEIEAAVRAGDLAPGLAASRLFALLGLDPA